MSISNTIRNILDIQDKNINFNETGVSIGRRFKKEAKFIYATLTYTPDRCKHCDIRNEGYTLYKNGTQKSTITLPMSGHRPTYLVLKKQRFRCKNCTRTFTAGTSLVNKGCFIANQVKQGVLMDTSTAHSIKDISIRFNVSEATTQRIINNGVKSFKAQIDHLPKHLSFDEFKYKSGKMAFEYINAQTGDIIDILPGRDGRTHRPHFLSRYGLDTREAVETITIDMNSSYIGVIEEIFPNAKIIIDRFHIVQLLNRALNKTRIQVMNRLSSKSEDQKKYRRLKKFWKKFLKSSQDVSHTAYKNYPLFELRTEGGIIDEMLSYNDTLSHSYDFYQKLLYALKQKDFTVFERIVLEDHPGISGHLKTSLKTLKKHLPYIKHSIHFPYNNGRLEGMNNKIKVLNKVAYGYRNFENYKNRIILHFKYQPKKEEQKAV